MADLRERLAVAAFHLISGEGPGPYAGLTPRTYCWELADRILAEVIDPEPVATVYVTEIDGERHMRCDPLPGAHALPLGRHTLYRLREEKSS